MTYILGITCFIHDSAAALIEDGQLVAACEEERFNREKHTAGFPVHAINYCLSEAGISIRDVDRICFYMKPSLGIRKRIPYIVSNLPRSLFFGGKHQQVWWNMTLLRWHLIRHFGFHPYRIRFMEHVMTHAASAFYPSPFDEAAILTVEGCGEWSTTFLGHGHGTSIERLVEYSYPHSLGFVYGAVTQYLGFRAWNGEGKVMGLAPYGSPRYSQVFEQMIQLDEHGGFHLDLSYFTFHIGKLVWYSSRFIDTFGPPRQPESEFTQVHKDIAASLQKRLEQTIVHIACWLYQQTKLPNLCLAGGVALNSSMNGVLLENTPFKRIFVQPAANDAGCAIGGPLYLSHNHYGVKNRHRWKHAYFGPSFTDREILKALEAIPYSVKRVENIAQKTAALLAEGKLVGWFQGRMEYGPRALGSRSILADPRNPDMKDILNSRVKFRESFRPFAPSVLEEYTSEYFQIDQETPYMLFITPVRPEKRGVIPAVVHVDGSARAQTVNREHSPLYWSLIHHFKELTGVPVLLNTSFNIRGEPIVTSPEDAVRCFANTGLDVLAIGSYLVEK